MKEGDILSFCPTTWKAEFLQLAEFYDFQAQNRDVAKEAINLGVLLCPNICVSLSEPCLVPHSLIKTLLHTATF